MSETSLFKLLAHVRLVQEVSGTKDTRMFGSYDSGSSYDGSVLSGSSAIQTNTGSTLANRGFSMSPAIMNPDYFAQEGSATQSYSEIVQMDTSAAQIPYPTDSLNLSSSRSLSSVSGRSSPISTPFIQPSLSSANLRPSSPSPTSSPSTKNPRHQRRNSTSSISPYKPLHPSTPFDLDPELGPPSRPATAKLKPKTQRLISLWPLPPVTRVVILLTLLVSFLSLTNFVPVRCSAPSYVIHRLEIFNLVLSPFLVPATVNAVAIAVWNLLVFAMFEESLTHVLGETRRFVYTLVGVAVGVFALRQLLGFLFSRSVGFAVPVLLFSQSMHECNQGLCPFLFSLLVIQSLTIDEKYIFYYGDHPGTKLTFRKVTLQLLMCFVNYMPKSVLWWSLTGLIIGLLATLILQILLHRDAATAFDLAYSSTKSFPTVDEPEPRKSLWGSFLTALRSALIVALPTFALLLFCNIAYRRAPPVPEKTLNALLPHDKYILSFVVMSAPRRGEPDFLERTIDSYVRQWPQHPEPGSLYDRLQMIVYTHFSWHPKFEEAKRRFGANTHMKWMQEAGNSLNQRLHIAKALRAVAEKYETTYIALLEDDFPVCGEATWREMLDIVYRANRVVPGHCGLFVGTGGSGLLLRRQIAYLAADVLLQYTDKPADIILQKCLAGTLPECAQCNGGLVTSRRLLMYHIGYNASTDPSRLYGKEQWQCGWRHPFNGHPDYITL